MGGGSSDAASTLLALNRLWKLDLPLPALEEIGLKLGADVPFFLRGHNAWVEGIGEIITPLEKAHQLPQARFAVVKPEAGLDTKSIFSTPDLKRDSDSATILGFAAAHYSFGCNDLQPVAQALCPEVTQALQWLKSRGLQGRMTGSGSAVFAQISHAVNLQNAPNGWQVRVCENLMIHPLAGWASDKNKG
jgi:4-diphosphocytidyl-2-C-methyl-D-erythritol kinase